MENFYEIQLDNGTNITAACENSLILNFGEPCIFRKDFYQDFGRVMRLVSEDQLKQKNQSDGSAFDDPFNKNGELPRILRKASPEEVIQFKENQSTYPAILKTTQQYVSQLSLPMKLVNVHKSFDGKMIVIQFSADGRVDFRELVKQLSSEFSSRVELWQIGVRDETAIIGGISMCGRPLCCCQFLNDFASINVKMAKEQDLSLTPATISGICGRLKCCLKYEHEGYLELEKTMPHKGDWCECPDGRGKIVDRNLLAQKVVIQLEENGHTVTCHVDEITVGSSNKHRNYDNGKADNKDTRDSNKKQS